MENLNLKSKTIIRDLSPWMDGGSITLNCENLAGQKFQIEFHQNMILDFHLGSKIPGRLYLNNTLVEVKSDLEKSIIENLEKGELDYDKTLPDYHLILGLLKEKIDYVNSEQYLKDYAETKKTYKK